MLKQIFSILLIASLTVPFICIPVYLKHEKKTLKREIKHRIIEGIDRSDLVQLVFTEEQAARELKWEHSKEFEFNGEMYDVVETEIKNGKITYWCWWDHKETSLNKQLNYLLAKALNQQDPKAPQKNAGFWLSLLYLMPQKTMISFETSTRKTHRIFAIQNLFESRYRDIVSPPPQPSFV